MDKDEILKYSKLGFSQRKIGTVLGVSQGTIRYWSKKFHLSFTRRIKERCKCGTVLKDNVYDVPVVVTKENQHSVGTIVAYIKVDADTGRVYQIQERLMY